MINVCKMCQYYETRKNEKPCSNCGDGKNWEPIWDMEIKRPEMLPEVVAKYDTDASEKPDSIRVSFADGSTEIYERRIQQPAPQILKSIRIVRSMKKQITEAGYQYQQPKRRRNRK